MTSIENVKTESSQDVIDNWNHVAQEIKKYKEEEKSGEHNVVTNIQVAVRVRPLNSKVSYIHIYIFIY